MSATSAPSRPMIKPERASFPSGIRAEWVKFRTVRGWLIAVSYTHLS